MPQENKTPEERIREILYDYHREGFTPVEAQKWVDHLVNSLKSQEFNRAIELAAENAVAKVHVCQGTGESPTFVPWVDKESILNLKIK